VRWTDRKQLGALVTNLMRKGVIADLERVHVNRENWITQYVIADAYRSAVQS
jgi:hypothetical protein